MQPRASALTLGLCLLGLPRTAAAQTESVPPPPNTKPAWTWKSGLSLGIVGTTYVGAWAFVSTAWWTRENASSFALHDEGAFGLGTYAGGADKLGHFYTNYLATRLYTDILEWGGFSRTVSMVSATLLTTAFFTGIELKDGYQRNYGFSLGDIAANLTGQATAIAMMLVPDLDEAVSIRLMYFPSRDFRRAVYGTYTCQKR